MKQHAGETWRRGLFHFAASLVTLAVLAALWQVRELRGEIRDTMRSSVPFVGSEARSSWLSGGIRREVLTGRRDGETVDEWAFRHRCAAEAILTAFPLDH